MVVTDGASSRRHGQCERSGIYVVSVRADAGENGLGAKSADGATGGHKSERREKDFVAGPNTARTQGENQGVRSGSQADAISDAAELGDLLFERVTFASQDELLRGHDALKCSSTFSADAGVLRRKIELRNGIERCVNLRM